MGLADHPNAEEGTEFYVNDFMHHSVACWELGVCSEKTQVALAVDLSFVFLQAHTLHTAFRASTYSWGGGGGEG